MEAGIDRVFHFQMEKAQIPNGDAFSCWRQVMGRILGIVLLFAGAAMAQGTVIPGRWEKLERLPRGAEVDIVLKSGLPLSALFERVEPGVLIVVVNGMESRVAAADVETVSRSFNDPTTDGTLRGALAGLGGGAALGVSVFKLGPYGAKPPGYGRSMILGFSVLGAGVGALAGNLRDKRQTSTELLFRAGRGLDGGSKSDASVRGQAKQSFPPSRKGAND